MLTVFADKLRYEKRKFMESEIRNHDFFFNAVSVETRGRPTWHCI